jgi:hypothetical protein
MDFNEKIMFLKEAKEHGCSGRRDHRALGDITKSLGHLYNANSYNYKANLSILGHMEVAIDSLFKLNSFQETTASKILQSLSQAGDL